MLNKNYEKDLEILNKLDLKDFDKVYNGKTGCACGCGGEYYEDEKAFKRYFNKMKKKIEDLPLQIQDDYIFYVTDNDRGRALRIYLK